MPCPQHFYYTPTQSLVKVENPSTFTSSWDGIIVYRVTLTRSSALGDPLLI